MVDKSNRLAFVIMAAVAWGAASTSLAADPPDLFLNHLADFVWTGAGGNSTWENAANWTPPTFPVGYPYAIPTYPNDPGRVDSSAVDIFPAVGANLSGAFAADRTVNIANGNVTVASLKLGGTGAAVTTNVTATVGNRLVFENMELNDTLTNPGDPNADPEIQPEPIWGFNQGRALIWSTGTAGVGKENRISADVQLNDNVDVEGNRDLHIFGAIIEGPSDEIPVDPTTAMPTLMGRRQPSISSLLSGGAKLYVHGNINVMAADDDPEMEGTQERVLAINSARGILTPADPQKPPTNPTTRQGVVDITGQFVGDGWISIGSPETARLPSGSVILRADNVGDNPMMPVYSGRIIIDRGNLVLAHNNALGGGDVLTGNPNTAVGFNLISDNDSRVISNDIQITQWHTIRGATGIAGLEGIGDHSITFSGRMTLSNSRGFINLLPAGETLTLSGPQYGLEEQDLDNLDDHRQYTIDGSGKTLVTGGIHNRVPEQAAAGLVDFRKRGSGTVIIDYDESNTEDTASDYQGYTYVEGGNLHFAQANDLPDSAEPRGVISTSGAVGLDSGLFTAGGALTADGTTFLNMLNNSANLDAPNSASPNSFLRLYGVRDVIFSRYDTGGLMLGAGDYNKNLDFSGSQASNPLARAANMTLAAHEGGSTYTGTITPAGFANGSPQPGATNPTGIPVSPDTYRLGGGSGKLTLPNNNQLVNGTGNRNLLVANGGEVELLGTNTYSGTTQIMRAGGTTLQLDAARDDDEDDPELDPAINPETRVSTRLTVNSLANGGQASSIGNSSSSASNLVVQGGTLKYIGGAVSTDRLFTVGTRGGTIDASGSGALTFSSTAALAIDTAEDRKGYLVGGLPNSDNNEVIGVPGVIPTGLSEIIPLDTSDLVPGMTIKDTLNQFGTPRLVDDDSNLEITNVGQNILFVGETDLDEDNDSDTEPPVPWPGYAGSTLDVATFQFGPAPARFLTLTGSNVGSNTLNPLVTDASDIGETDGAPGGKGSVGIQKSGVGKWILTGNNTYSGETNVEAGTLIVNGNQSGNGVATVSAGATVGGGGTLPGALVNNGLVAPGATTTGTLTVQGNYKQSFGATLAVEIGGTAAGAFDALHVVAGVDTGPIEGDYNEDGSVNGADYTVWRDHLGQTFNLPNEGEDAETMGVVDQEDYDIWKENFGEENLSLGLASISGMINIDLINGFTPLIGSMFTILTAPEGLTASGLSLAGEKNGFSLIANATSLVLHYTGAGSGSVLGGGAVPEPTGLMLGLLAMIGVGGLRHRK